MSQKLYESYTNDIANYLRYQKEFKSPRISGHEKLKETLSVPSEMYWHDKVKNEALFRSLSPLNSISGIKAKYEEKLGSHPSFSYLKNSNKSERHYIVTMFLDIKNSTGLFKKYDPEIVANICRTIQLAAIHTCWYFDGYIQRLQGDGLMVYFGGKNITEQNAVDNALMASSFISYFVKNDLKNLFDQQGVNQIYTRIGLDFGNKNKTLWHNAGYGECSEVTTTSLHTSLACKMEAQAGNNGIFVGDHILDLQSKNKGYFTYKNYKRDGKDYPYVYEIPEEGFKYKQYDFNWHEFLKNHNLVSEDDQGNLIFNGPSILPNPNIQNNSSYIKENASNYRPYF